MVVVGGGVSSQRSLHSPRDILSVLPPGKSSFPPGVFSLLSPHKCSHFFWGCLTLVTPRVRRPYTPPHPVVWLQVELSDGTAHTITDAYAGKEYIIQVAAKDNEIGTWSDWSVAAHATPWTEEPRHLTTEAQAPGEPAPWAPSCSSRDLEHLLQGSPQSVWLPHSRRSVQPLLFLVLAVWTLPVGASGWRGPLCALGKQRAA